MWQCLEQREKKEKINHPWEADITWYVNTLQCSIKNLGKLSMVYSIKKFIITNQQCMPYPILFAGLIFLYKFCKYNLI